MNYISLNIAFSDAMQAEILTAELADYPFESFEADAGTLKAYIPQERLADCKGEVDALLAHYHDLGGWCIDSQVKEIVFGVAQGKADAGMALITYEVYFDC